MQMAPSEALALEVQLAPMLLQGLVPIIAARNAGPDVQARVLSDSIASIVGSMPPEKMASMVKYLCEQTFLNGQRVDFETAFLGSKGVILRYRIALFVLEANYSDFLSELLPAGVVDRAKQMFEVSQNPPATSTGESGDPASRPHHSVN
jgi:hypothetical protein